MRNTNGLTAIRNTVIAIVAAATLYFITADRIAADVRREMTAQWESTGAQLAGDVAEIKRRVALLDSTYTNTNEIKWRLREIERRIERLEGKR